MHKIIKNDSVSINVSGGVSFAELTNRYSEKCAELINKYDNVHNIKVTCESYEYNDGENYAQELVIYFDRNETDEECERRLNWIEQRNKDAEECNIKHLKELIIKYPDLANKYISEINNK